MSAKAVTARIDQLAEDIGRLRRRAEPDTSLAHLGDRLADNTESLDAMTHPTAADIYHVFTRITDDEAALRKALALTDLRATTLREKLGREER